LEDLHSQALIVINTLNCKDIAASMAFFVVPIQNLYLDYSKVYSLLKDREATVVVATIGEDMVVLVAISPL